MWQPCSHLICDHPVHLRGLGSHRQPNVTRVTPTTSHAKAVTNTAISRSRPPGQVEYCDLHAQQHTHGPPKRNEVAAHKRAEKPLYLRAPIAAKTVRQKQTAVDHQPEDKTRTYCVCVEFQSAIPPTRTAPGISFTCKQQAPSTPARTDKPPGTHYPRRLLNHPDRQSSSLRPLTLTHRSGSPPQAPTCPECP